MALDANVAYVIVNRATGTVLDFTGNDNRNFFVMGWAGHNGANQHWTLALAIIPGGNNSSTLVNGRQVNNIDRFLGIQQGNEDAEPVAIPPVGPNSRVCAPEAPARNFFIEALGVGNGFRLRTGPGNPQNMADAALAVTIITGNEPAPLALGHIAAIDRVPALADNGAPLILRPFDAEVAPDPAQVWDFVPAAGIPVLRPGRYTIRNNVTGTVLDLSANLAQAPFVTGWASHGGANQQWIVQHNLVTNLYTLQSVRQVGHAPLFLARPDGLPVPVAGVRLIGAAAPLQFNILQVPATHDYQIFLGAHNHVVNLENGAGVVPVGPVVANLFENGPPAVLRLQPAQAWSFIAVEPLA